MYILGAIFTVFSLVVFILEIIIFKFIRFDFTLKVEEYAHSQVTEIQIEIDLTLIYARSSRWFHSFILQSAHIMDYSILIFQGYMDSIRTIRPTLGACYSHLGTNKFFHILYNFGNSFPRNFLRIAFPRNFLRIAFPLAYNFLMMVRVRATSYNQVFNTMTICLSNFFEVDGKHRS